MKKYGLLGLTAVIAVALAVVLAVVLLDDDSDATSVALGPEPQAEASPPSSSGGEPGALVASELPAPPGSDPGSIPAGCLVPDVRGKTIGVAVISLRVYECAPGTVARKRSTNQKKGVVLAQSVAPGAQLRAGAKVGLTVGSGR